MNDKFEECVEDFNGEILKIKNISENRDIERIGVRNEYELHVIPESHTATVKFSFKDSEFTVQACGNENTENFLNFIENRFSLKKSNNQQNSLNKLIDKYNDIEKHSNLLKDICYGLSKEAGWHDEPREAGTMIALIHSEISEALEGVRKNLMDDHLPDRRMVEVEMADAVIRIMDFCGKYNLDIGGAIVDKLNYNTKREDHKKENRQKKGGKAF